MAAIDFSQVFAVLRPGENVSPVVGDAGVTYQQIADTWRGTGTIPTEAECNAAWANIEAMALVGTPRPYTAILADIAALTGANQTTIWTDLITMVGTQRKIIANSGIKGDVLGLWEFIILSGVLSGAPLADAKRKAAAVYVLANNSYLVNPSFLPAVSINGLYTATNLP